RTTRRSTSVAMSETFYAEFRKPVFGDIAAALGLGLWVIRENVTVNGRAELPQRHASDVAVEDSCPLVKSGEAPRSSRERFARLPFSPPAGDSPVGSSCAPYNAAIRMA